jgi:membrane fusion protein (multidrug efflux system)
MGQKPTVGVIEVEPQLISMTNELPGRVVAYRVAEIRPQVSGIIQSRLFKEGSFVEKGQQLYQIDPARYEAEYQMAQAALQREKADLQKFTTLAERYDRLIKSNAVSKQEYDNAIADVNSARARIAVAEASVRTAKINLDYTKVYAPISGYISPSSVTEGALVTAQQAESLATVRQLDPVYVDITQAAAEAQQLQQRIAADRMNNDDGEIDKYSVTLILGNIDETYPFKGTLDATDLSVDQATGSIRLRSVFENPNGVLLPGMFVRASLTYAGDTKTIIIPQKAVKIEPDGSKSVMTVNAQGMVEKKTISTGASYRNNWVVLNGLDRGDRVIVEGTMMIGPGMPVNVRMINDEGQNQGQESEQVTPADIPSDTLDDRAPPPVDFTGQAEDPQNSRGNQSDIQSNEANE